MKSVRQIIRTFQENLQHEDSKTKITETAKFQISTSEEELEKLVGNNLELNKDTTEKSVQALDRLLDDFTFMKNKCLEHLYGKYKENEIYPLFDLNVFLSDKDHKDSKLDSKYLIFTKCDSWEKIKARDKTIKSFFRCPDCKKNLALYLFSDIYFAACETHETRFLFYENKKLDINNKKTKDKEDGGTLEDVEFAEEYFDLKLESAQTLSGFYSAFFITEKGNKYTSDFYTKSYKPLQEADYKWDSIVGASLREALAKDISSFYTRFFKSLRENFKVFNNNQLALEDIKKLIKDKSIDCKELAEAKLNFPEHFTRSSIDIVNSEIKRLNMFINEALWQKNNIKKEQAKKLKTLKGVPSFPVIELNQTQSVNKNTLLSILKKNLSGIKEEVQNLDEGIKKQVIECWIEKFYSEKLLGKKKNPNQSLAKLLAYYISSGKITNYNLLFSTAVEFIERKIDKLEEHLVVIEKDILAFQRLNNWLRTLSTYLLWHIREVNISKFIDDSQKVNEIYGNLRGIKSNQITKEFEIPGFSLSNNKLQYGGTLALTEDKQYNKKKRYFLVLSLEKSDKKKALQRIKVLGNKKTDNNSWSAFVKEKGETLRIRKISFDPSEENMIVLPLKLGKRQGRKYLWSFDYFNPNSRKKNSNLTINNGRITYEDGKYYFAVTYQFDYEQSGLSDYHPETIIGLDRGENTPIVAALVDMSGNLINLDKKYGIGGKVKNPLSLEEKYKEKQKETQKQKEEEQRELGKYSNKIAKKQKNVSENMINNSAKVLLNLVYDYNGILIFEDLYRGFGRRGKNTLACEKQYTKLEDTILQKLFSCLVFKRRLETKYIGIYNDKNKIVGKVRAGYTSSTCSSCGRIYREENDKLQIMNSLKVGDEISFELEHNNQKKVITSQDKELLNKLKQIIKNKELANISKTNKEKISDIIYREIVKPRKDGSYKEFDCIWCNHKTDADEQAALNIARKWLFKDSKEYKLYKKAKDSGNKDSEVKAWQEFYLKQIKENLWKPSPKPEMTICQSVI